jgi:ribonucleoside-diphosphate reductase alpha chain
LEEKMSDKISVKKRNGSIEPLQLEKIHRMVSEACDGISGVSVSQVEMSSGIQFYDGITTEDIQEILIKSAADLISLDHPGYQYVAARLLLFSLRKKLYGGRIDLPTLKDQIKKGIELGVYDPAILQNYNSEELEKLNGYIDHDRDLNFTYAGLKQVIDKYLVQDRADKRVHETPQFMYMLIAMTLFAAYPKDTRLSYVKRYYDASSKHKINIPTPIMAGVRTKKKQGASCTLIEADDDLESIIASGGAIMKYVADKAGIGLNVGRLRALGSKIRGGETISTGLIPYLRYFQGALEAVHQGGLRKGSMTVFVPLWHKEIEQVIVMKNNKGNEETRARNIDYAIGMSKIFYERFIQNGVISLFCPNDVPGLFDAFGFPEFDDLYVKYENDPTIDKKQVGAQELIIKLLNERSETGRIYIFNIDHANSHSSFLDKVNQSNLCMEVILPTKPIKDINDTNGEIALCVLGAVNVGVIKSDKELEEVTDLIVRGLDELIDFQDYVVPAAEKSTRARRSLGVGIIGLAHYFAKLGVSYEEQAAWDYAHQLAESLQYYLLKASVNVAKEKGACDYFNRTKYSQGILPIDTYKKEVDEITNVPLKHDWEELRQEILTYGLRHSTLSSCMPSESSSVTSNATNGIEPPKELLSVKRRLKQVVPQYSTLKSKYTTVWEMKSNKGYLNVAAALQKFFDQAISINWNYNPENYPDKMVPMSEIVDDWLYAYRSGAKTAYYLNTYDGAKEEKEIDLDDLLNDNGEESCDGCTI